jgi:hypothetical protein
MSANLSKTFAGRKRESAVWHWFVYDEKNDKTVCQVQTAKKKDVPCGSKLNGKNPTNMKV